MSVTLVVALAGLVISSTSLTWQVLNYRLTGARLRCEFHLGTHDGAERPSWQIAPADTWRAIPESHFRRDLINENALIIVRNIGRVAVTVQPPQLDVGVLPVFGRSRFGIAMLMPDGFGGKLANEPSGPTRLDPGGVAAWRLDFWEIIGQARRADPTGTFQVRAAVEDAADRVHYSSSRNSLTVDPTMKSIIG